MKLFSIFFFFFSGLRCNLFFISFMSSNARENSLKTRTVVVIYRVIFRLFHLFFIKTRLTELHSVIVFRCQRLIGCAIQMTTKLSFPSFRPYKSIRTIFVLHFFNRLQLQKYNNTAMPVGGMDFFF